MALWASGVIVGRWAHDVLPPVGFSFWRWVLAGIVLTPFVWPRLALQREQVLESWRHFFLLALCLAGGSTLLLWSLQYTTATNASLISGTQPVLTPLLAWLILRERLTTRLMLGATLTLWGIVAMVARLNLEVLKGLAFNVGDILIFAAVICYGLYSIYVQRWMLNVHPLVTMYMTCLGAASILFPCYLAESATLGGIIWTARGALAIAYMALIPTLLAVTLWNICIAAVGASRATTFINLIPVFGVLLAILFLGEKLHVYHLIGGTLVCIGITVVVWRPRSWA